MTANTLNYIKSGYLYHFVDFNGLEYYFFCSQHPKARDLLSRSIDILLATGVTLLTFDSTVQIGDKTVQILYEPQFKQWFSYYQFDVAHYFPLHGLIAASRKELVAHLNYAYVKRMQEIKDVQEKNKLFSSLKKFNGVMF